MAYQEVLAPATAAGVVDAIRSFAQANGWTVLRNDLVSTSRTVTLKRPETDHIHVYNTTTNEIRAIGSVDYNGALPPETNPLRGVRARSGLIGNGPYTRMHLFAADLPAPHIHVVIELTTAGVFRHLSFGMVEKIEPFTGGSYTAASNWNLDGSPAAPGYNSQNHAMFGRDTLHSSSTDNDCIRVDFAADSRTNFWYRFANDRIADATVGTACSGLVHPSSSAVELTGLVGRADNNAFSNRSVLHPFDIKVNRIGDYWSRIGTFPNVRYCNIFKFAPGDEFTIAGDVWKIFPMARKFSTQLNVASPVWQAHSNNFAYAYKKVP
ncbi:MAG: hypothetical protein DDT26_00297 [Dehalococcoidia bacterium]|nr:hypothetical protein [Chloroflexota bacterium]